MIVSGGYQVLCLTGLTPHGDAAGLLQRVWLHSSYIISKRRPVFWVCEGPQEEELQPRFLIHPSRLDGKPHVLTSFRFAKTIDLVGLVWSLSFFRLCPTEAPVADTTPTELEV